MQCKKNRSLTLEAMYVSNTNRNNKYKATVPPTGTTSIAHTNRSIQMKETDKRYEANRQVKLKIARALTKLMDTKAFSDISVTDIITTAGVARASYYRNFHSKEEVLIKITDDIMEEYRKRAEKLENDFFSYEAILLIFRYFKTYKKFILSVYKAGLAYIYLDLFDQELENHMGDMPYNDIHRYKVYFYSGALYNVFLKWLQNGMKEHPSAMAAMVTEMLEQGAYPLA